MRKNEKLTLVHPSIGRELFWNLLPSEQNVIMVPNLERLAGALRASVGEDQRDVRHVVLDSSVSADQFLGFLSGLPVEFRGDVLMIQQDGSGFLSSLVHHDGRALYQLENGDVEFYLQVHYGDSFETRLAAPEPRFLPAPAYF